MYIFLFFLYMYLVQISGRKLLIEVNLRLAQKRAPIDLLALFFISNYFIRNYSSDFLPKVKT